MEGRRWGRLWPSIRAADLSCAAMPPRLAGADSCASAFLRLGGRAAAVQIAVQVAHGFWLLKIGYREEFARCSPGTLLMCETIAYAAKAGLRTYEFLGRDEAWLHMWNPLGCPCVSIAAYPFNARGMLAMGQDAFAAFRRKLTVVPTWR